MNSVVEVYPESNLNQRHVFIVPNFRVANKKDIVRLKQTVEKTLNVADIILEEKE